MHTQSPTLDEFRGRQIDLYRRKESLDRLTAELYLATHQEDDQKPGYHSVLNSLSGLSLQRRHHTEPALSRKRAINPSDVLSGINDDVAAAMTLTRDIIFSAEEYAELNETHASHDPLCSILEHIASSSTQLSSIVERLDTKLQQLITVLEDGKKREGARKKRNKSLEKVEKGCTGAAIVFAVGACIPGPQTPAFGALSALSLAVAGLCKLLKKPSESASKKVAWQVIRESLFEAKNVRGSLVTFRGSVRELTEELAESSETTLVHTHSTSRKTTFLDTTQAENVDSPSTSTLIDCHLSQHDTELGNNTLDTGIKGINDLPTTFALEVASNSSSRMPSYSRPRSTSSTRHPRRMPSLVSVLENMRTNAQENASIPSSSDSSTPSTAFTSGRRNSLAAMYTVDCARTDKIFSPISDRPRTPISFSDEPSSIPSLYPSQKQVIETKSGLSACQPTALTHRRSSISVSRLPGLQLPGRARTLSISRSVNSVPRSNGGPSRRGSDESTASTYASRSRSSTITFRDPFSPPSPPFKSLGLVDDTMLGPMDAYLPRKSFSFPPVDYRGPFDAAGMPATVPHHHDSQVSQGRFYSCLWWNDSSTTVVEEPDTPVHRPSSFSLPWMTAFTTH